MNSTRDYEDFLLHKNPLDGSISGSDLIPADLVTLISRNNQNICSKFFNGKGWPPTKYRAEFTCYACAAVEILECSKTKFFELCKRFTCAKCSEKIKDDQRRSNENHQANMAAQQSDLRLQNTSKFENEFLSPNHHWNKATPVWQMIKILKSSWSYCDQDHVSGLVQGMLYSDFLKTPFWAAIAADVKKRAGWKCELCSGTPPLHAHHNTYKNHGRELDTYTNDIIALCAECHEKFHVEREVS